MTRLEPMTKEEFIKSLDEVIESFAKDRVARGHWSEEAAVEMSRSNMVRQLPQGFATPGYSFLKIVDERTGERVGETWYSIDSIGGRRRLWIEWIEVDPPFRRHGHAKRALEELARRATAAGCDRVELHTLADSVPALALYSSLGYTPSSHFLEKRLANSDL